nr:adenylosuccinate synthetase [Rubellimicrobium mesophilum]
MNDRDRGTNALALALAWRHGSTGLGFGETIERQETGPRLVAADLWAPDLEGKLAAIRDGWMPRRLAVLGLDPEASPLRDVLTGRLDLLERFRLDCLRFTTAVALREDADLGTAGAVLFEGAQGLQLDMDYGVMPHCTRSNTGLKNMLAIAAEAGFTVIDALYVTRAYATRHGAGPLPHETPDATGAGRIGWAEIVDLTNAANPWQGVIRQAPLDLDLLHATIARDLALAEATGVRVSPGLGVTCLDQIRSHAEVVQGGAVEHLAPEVLPLRLSAATGLPLGLLSYGPTRVTIEVPARRATTICIDKALPLPVGGRRSAPADPCRHRQDMVHCWPEPGVPA